MSIPFEEIGAALLAQAETLVPQWLPHGKRRGAEWICGDLYGEVGESCKVNLQTGLWKDFSSGEGGRDLISLYAAINGCGQGEAARRLQEDVGVLSRPIAAPPKPAPAPEPEPEPITPDMLESATFEHPEYGPPAARWVYSVPGWGALCVICRHDPPGGRKQIIPWTNRGGRLRMKGIPDNRPLYNLRDISEQLTSKVLVVEGEKAADAARQIVPPTWVVTTWMGGASAVNRTDWSALAGRHVTIWPDHDKPGLEAAEKIAGILAGKAASLRWIDTRSDDLPDGWDAADAVSGGFTRESFVAWAKARVKDWAGELGRQPEPAARPPADVVERTESADAGRERGSGGPPGDTGIAVPPDHTEPKPRAKRGKRPNLQVVEPDGTVRKPDPPPVAPPEMDEPSAALAWVELGLQTNAKGKPHPNIDNVVRALASHSAWKDALWYDEFANRVMTADGKAGREWTDADDIRLALWLQRAIGIYDVRVSTVADAVVARARECKRNELTAWLGSLTWDGKERLIHLFPDGFGADRNRYTEAVGRCFIVSLCARAFAAGCKVDAMPVLEGKQGVGKSTGLAALGGEWYAEMHEEITGKDFLQSLGGKWLIEISELHSFRRAEVDRIKGVISCSTDRYRASYGRRSEDYPRRCVFAGTTNRDDWVADDTGARRFWPILCSEVNHDWIRANREQMFAEGVARFRRGESWWDVPAKEAAEEQEARRQTDAWESLVRRYTFEEPMHGIGGEVTWRRRPRPLEKTTVGDVLRDAIGLPEAKWTRGDQMRVAAALRLVGYIRRRSSTDRFWTYRGESLGIPSPLPQESEAGELF